MLSAKRPTPRRHDTDPRRALRRVRRLVRDAAAVSPVVGTSLILVITVLGMAGVLFWGTPTLQGIQDRGSVVGMEGEFDELRRAMLELSVPDASRVPTVVMEDGILSLEDGTRMMVAVAMDANNELCDMSVSGWEDSPSSSLVVDLTGCRNALSDIINGCSDCLEVHKVTGSSTIQQSVSWSHALNDPTYTATDLSGTLDFGTGDWLVRYTNGASTPTIYAEAWILDQKRISWRLSTSVSAVDMHLEGGAVFQVDEGSFFLHRPPAVREDAFGSEDYVLRLVTLLGTDSGSAGRGTPEVFLGLVGNHIRTSTSAATQVRYTFDGDIAEAWCQSLLLRNGDLETGTQPKRVYTTTGCAAPTPSIVFRVTDTDTNTRETFPFEFIHARVTSSIRA